MRVVSVFLSVSIVFVPLFAEAGFRDLLRCLRIVNENLFEIPQARMKVGYEPDAKTGTGLFKSEHLSDGRFTERSGTLDGDSVWISALDGTYQSRLSYVVKKKGHHGDHQYQVKTLVAKGVETEGVARGSGLEAGVLQRAVERNPSVQEVRVKIQAPNVRFDYANPEANDFAVRLSKEIARDGAQPGGALDVLPEYQALVKMGFKFDSERSGLWHYSLGDVDHYFLVMTRTKP